MIPHKDRVIFLDVDGVLTHQAYGGDFRTSVAPSCLALLNELTDATGAGIVVSSAWRLLDRSMADLVGRFARVGVTGKVVGRTPILNHIDGVGRRPGEIAEWLARRGPRGPRVAVALDDDIPDGAWLPEPVVLVRTEFAYGLQRRHVEAALHVLLSDGGEGSVEPERCVAR